MSFVLNDNIFGGGSGSSGGGGKGKNVTLLSVTTAPSAPFEKGSKYYDSTTKKIYTAVSADTWTGAKEDDPQFYTIYIYDNNGTTEYYQWDGDDLVETDLEKYQLISNISQNYADTSTVHYPSSKALSDGIDSVKPQLYDTQIFTEPKDKDNEARKGWAAICNSTRQDLAKADVPTVYADIFNKYENVEKEQTTIQTKSISGYNGIPYLNIGEYFYFVNGYKIYKSKNADLTNATEVFDMTTKTSITGYTFLARNSNYVIAIMGSEYGFSPAAVFVFDLQMNYLGHKESPTTTLRFGFSMYFSCATRFFDDGYFYFLTYDRAGLTRVNIIDWLLNDADFEYLDLSISYNGYYFMFEKIGDTLVGVRQYNGQTNIFSIDFSNLTTTVLYASPNVGYQGGIVNNNGQMLVYSGSKLITYENGNFVETPTNMPYNTRGIRSYLFVGDMLYARFDIDGNDKIYTTTDFTTFTWLCDATGDDGFGTDFSNILYTGDNFVSVGGKNNYTYFGVLPKEHTQSFGDITITYYKYNDWKICVPDTDNDNALDDLYSVYGYCPFWRIDIENETITLQRNSNKFAMMYVGDDYEEDTFPSGDWERAALISEVQPEVITIDTASVTRAIQANKNYVLSNANLTDITFTACETSYKETTIQFSTGSNVPQLDDTNAGIEWVDGSAPILSANSSYIILIWNKKGFVREY